MKQSFFIVAIINCFICNKNVAFKKQTIGNKRQIRITKLGQELLLETKNKPCKLVSTKYAVTSVLSSVTTDRPEKCIKASYKVAKVNTKGRHSLEL